MLTKEQENVLSHLLSLPKDEHNTVSIGKYMDTYPSNIDEKTLIQTFTYLEQEDFINLKWYGVRHDSLSYAVDVSLLSKALSYYKDKAAKKKTKRQEWIKWLIPTIISIIALLWDLANTLYCSNLKDMLVK